MLAGRPGGFGYLDGKGADARLSLGDNSVATDAAGNVYLLDHGARIRRVTTEGVVSTRAVKVVIPRPESPITSYAFAVDKEGNFFVTDGPNNRILKVSAAGVVTTYAGSGVAGSADGPAASAQFWAPIGLALADDGTLYVSDYYNATIRRISPDGVVSTLAGQPQSTGAVDGRAAQARFQFPTWLALASDGRLVVSDNRLVRTVDEGGRVTTVGRLPETDYAGSVAEYAGVIYVRSRATGGVLRTRAAIPTGLRPGPASTTPTAWRRTGPATCT